MGKAKVGFSVVGGRSNPFGHRMWGFLIPLILGAYLYVLKWEWEGLHTTPAMGFTSNVCLFFIFQQVTLTILSRLLVAKKRTSEIPAGILIIQTGATILFTLAFAMTSSELFVKPQESNESTGNNVFQNSSSSPWDIIPQPPSTDFHPACTLIQAPDLWEEPTPPTELDLAEFLSQATPTSFNLTEVKKLNATDKDAFIFVTPSCGWTGVAHDVDSGECDLLLLFNPLFQGTLD